MSTSLPLTSSLQLTRWKTQTPQHVSETFQPYKLQWCGDSVINILAKTLSKPMRAKGGGGLTFYRTQFKLESGVHSVGMFMSMRV